MTIYDREGLKATLEDDGIAIYIEGVWRCELTRQELIDIAFASMENEYGTNLDS